MLYNKRLIIWREIDQYIIGSLYNVINKFKLKNWDIWLNQIKKKVFKIIHSIYYYYHCLIIAHNVLTPIKFLSMEFLK